MMTNQMEEYSDEQIEEWNKEDLLPVPDDAPWINTTYDGFMTHEEMLETAAEREQANKDLEIIENAASKAADILHISLPPEINKTRFVYLYTLLYAVMGQDDENMIHWLNTHNKHLDFVPVTRLTDEQSLSRIVSYLENFL